MALARAMCRHITADKPQTIIELGAGTGAVTRGLVQAMHQDSRLISVEIDHDFAQVLRMHYPQAEVLECDVVELKPKLAELGVDRADVFVSGLPTPSLPKAVNVAVLEAFRDITGDGAGHGVFSQLTVMPYVYKSFYQKLFDQVDFDLVVANIPPGGAYHCRGLKDDFADRLPDK